MGERVAGTCQRPPARGWITSYPVKEATPRSPCDARGDPEATLPDRRLGSRVEVDVTGHDSTLPHSAFKGQMPDEMYFGNGDDVPKELETRMRAARLARLHANRLRSCPACDGPDDSAAA